MGVDFLTCNSCEDTFPDCGHFVSCECGMHWCSDRCANNEGYEKNDEGEKSCNFCREEDFLDYELLAFAMKELNVSREELIKKYKALK